MIEITVNEWRVPSVEKAFDGWLEGTPTAKERAQILAEVAVARAAWKPTPQGLQQLEQINEFIGSRVRIQLWDSCMWLMPQEGPNPFKGTLVGLVMLDVDGFPQPYLQVNHYIEQQTTEGYSPKSYLKNADGVFLVPMSELYTITKLSGGNCVSD
jgi:hypothetical protein